MKWDPGNESHGLRWKPAAGWISSMGQRDRTSMVNGDPKSNSKTGLSSARQQIPPRLAISLPTFPPSLSQYLRLLVVLHGHGDHIEANHSGDEQVQVMAGAHLVDQETEAGVIRIVGLTLCFCSREEESGEARQVISLRLSGVNAPSLSNSKDDKF